MPNKHNAARRHHIPKMKFKVTNWPEYEAGLRQRGSITLWVTDEAIANWQAAPRLTPGGQARYSDTAIETGLMLRLAFHLPLRQTEGFMRSIADLLDLPIEVPDHTTFSRRATTLPSVSPGHLPEGPLHLLIDSTGLKVYGAGEWLQEKHGVRARRTWRKLHLGVDANSGMIVASTLTEQKKGDPSQVGPLLDQITGEIEKVTADGAYDGAPTYQLVEQHGKDITVVIPPPVTAILSDDAEQAPSQRDRHVSSLAENGRLAWQKETGYGRRSLAETAMGRYKSIISPRLRARNLGGQCTEAAIGVAVLNRMLETGRPKSVRSMGKSS
ncbi:MAG: IS5 family transposase [Amphritea sp.]